MSRSTLGALHRFHGVADHPYLWQTSGINKYTLFGHEIVLLDELCAYNASFDYHTILFGNFKAGYQIVDRSNFNVMRDPFSAKPYVEFYTTKRVGGDVIQAKAIKIARIMK